MNLQKPEDWTDMRDELLVILRRVFADYKIHVHALPPDTQERKSYHTVGGSAMTHLMKIINMVRMTEAHAEIPSSASVDAAVNEVRAAIAAEEAKEEGDPGDDQTRDFARDIARDIARDFV